MSDWLHHRLPYDPPALPHMLRLPGTAPLGDAPWLLRDEAFAGQMRLRDALVAERPGAVMASVPEAGPALAELLAAVRAQVLRDPGYAAGPGGITRPDGVLVPADAPPLVQLARLVQEDLCLLLPDGAGQHRLVAATLLFPAHWVLAEKIGRPLTGLHRIVPGYDADLARRVQRLFDAIRPGRGLWRFNLHGQADARLYSPVPEAATKPPRPATAPYLRSERQTLTRLSASGAILFGIHSYLLPRARLSPALAALIDGRPAATSTAKGPGPSAAPP
jgi:hypothetical protein